MVVLRRPSCYLLRLFIFLCFVCFSSQFNRDYYNSLFRPMSLNKAKVETLGNILKRHVQKLRDTKNRKVDLVFLVDSSASVGANNFFDELKFVRKLLADFTVDVNATRVSVITFSSRGKVIRHVDHLTVPRASNQKCGLLADEMPKIRYIGGGTYTLGAFIEAKNVLRAARPEAAKAIFLITDGFSNGGDPRPEATALRSMGVDIFTFGIRNGNVRELFDMASEPRNETCYILDSFEEFEALARRALHEDLHSGTYVLQTKSSCSSLCKDGKECCHLKADCMCGTHTGKYECLCQPGYYGHGFGKTGCAPCPSNTYKNYTGGGDISSCLKCPDDNHVTGVGATSIAECLCKKGYHNTTDIQCAAYRCPLLEAPTNGYFVNNKCNNVFNAACGLRCRPGYELRGSSLRICQEDSTWSGTTTECIMKTCPPLSTPKHGHMICSRDDFTYSTECRFTCDNGFKLVGSRKKTCLAIALWTGITTRCREITCQPLPALRDGVVSPAGCTAGEVLFGTTCQMTCLSAYTLYGPSNKQCTPDGNWAPPGSQPNQCIDENPPYMQCPKKLVIEADPEEPETLVNWQIPVAVDNSGLIPTTIAVPALVPPARLPIGYTSITYIAEDWNKNKAKCKVYIHVVDRTPPRVDRCFSPKAVVSPDKYGNVTWEEPLFSDNSGDAVQVVKTHTPGWFSLGKTNVTYTAIDKSGNNNTCVLEINVIPHPCEFPTPPVNGNRTCFENEEGVICKIFCMEGYAFAIPPAAQYFCAYDNIWRPEDQMPFPDCSVKEVSNDLVQEASFTFSGKLSCRNRQILNQIKSKFERKVTNRINEICVNEVHCAIDDLEATCEEDDDFNKVKVDFGSTRRRRRRTKRAVLTDRKRRSKRAAVLTDGKTFITFDFLLEGSISSTGKTADAKTSQKKLEKTMKKVMKTLQDDAKDGILDLQSLGKKVFFNGMEMDSDTPQFQCSDGKVLLGSDCVNCPVGTFFNVVSKQCESCGKGTYQKSEGMVTCLVCPNKTSTSQNHSRSEGECLAQCLPGSFSTTGLERCETCQIGFYQPQYSQTNCTNCPPGLTTARRGGRTRKDCKEICPRGYVSKNGLEPCFACPRGTFQPDPQKSGCFECPNNSTTFDIASIALTDCEGGDWTVQNDGSDVQNQQQQLQINDCFEDPCSNGGTCIPKAVSFSCKCPPGFGGIFCQTVVDECKSKPCLNNGTCLSLPGDYQCTCLKGFTGKKCEINIDDCLPSPCQHGGTCIDDVNSFRCNCAPGYQGVRCDANINDCSDKPCRNGGQCVDKLTRYECKCRKGYSGLTCEIEEDECLSSPCRNNATCVDAPGSYSCTCLPGYSGKRCGQDINDCKPNPCQNKAKCEDLLNGFLCHCSAGFRGNDCSTPLDANYQLDFASAGITDSAQFKFPDTPLTSLTVTFWMKTDDILNFGTPYSYAVPGMDNAFTLTDYNGFAILVNQEKRVTDLVANDGVWHHIVVSWSSNRGAWKIYQDGLIIDSDWDLSTGRPIPGGGMFVIGQEQDDVGGQFSSSESFVGSLTHLNVWDEELSLDVIDDMRITCNKYLGNILAWPDVYKGLRGTLSESPSMFCQDCPVPAKPDFGDVAYTGLNAGSTVTASCLRGFNVVGMNDQLCLATGEWEEQPPTCVKVECGFPGNIKNGYTEGRRYSFDNRVRYMCYEGYKLQGSKTRYCNEYGEWEGDKPLCAEITCELPLLSVNTVVANPLPKYIPRDRVKFKCTPGHRMFTSYSSVRCQTDGTWDKSVPTCDLQKCRSAPSIQNGAPVNEKDEYSVGGHVIYECDFGYTLSVTANNKVTCLPSGDWDADLPVCRLVTCPEVPMIAHANVSDSDVIFLSAATYTCHSGYTMLGADTIECYETGEWTPAAPECRPVSCGEPPEIPNGLVKGFIYTLNSIINYQCDAGYRLNAETRSTCLETGFWSGEERICYPIKCEEPRPIQNGNITMDKLTFQSVVTYTCANGYELVGTKERSCLEAGLWSSTDPSCSPVSCGPPPDLTNGNFNGLPPYIFSKTVVYHCNVGYEVLGNTNLTCESDAKWNDVVPLCLQITCPPVTDPINGIVNALGLTYTSKAEYSCSNGYRLEGVSSRTCQLDKTWTNVEPTCQPTLCQKPDEILNGKIEFKDLNVGSIVSHTCDKAHILIGDEIRRCQGNLTWSGQSVTCQPIQCPPLLNLTHGIVETSGNSYNSFASYHCDEGYFIQGDEERVCSEMGVWSGVDPACQIVECDKTATVISNGKMVGNQYIFGSVITYTCDDGYTLVGSDTRTCESNGEWDQPLPVCQIVQCPSYLLANGYVDGFKRDFNSVVTYSCKKNFRLEGPYSRKCLSGGVWEGNDPICVKIVCLKISKLDFGSFVTIDSRTVKYQCNEGFELIGPEERRCQENSTWSFTDPYCEIIKCPDLSNETIIHGSIIQNEFTFNSIVDFICDKGYQLEGETGALCNANGTWSNELATCSIVSCGKPGAVLNGIINGTVYTFGAMLYYTCVEGTKMVGSSTRQCGANGLWLEPSLRCEQIVCPDLPNIEFGKVTMLSNTYQGIAEYKCIAGYELFGLESRECLVTGVWEDHDPVCAPIHCHHPRPIANGDITGSDYHFQKEIVYLCNPGYFLVGDSVRTCTERRRWSGKKPLCNIIQCEAPEYFDHGQIIGNVYEYNSTISYVCNKGYNLIGRSSRQCMDTSSWDGIAPYCERVSCGDPPVVPFSTVLETDRFVNTSNIFECNVGYEPIGDPTITCLLNATWSWTNFRCEIVTCPAIRTILKGVVVGNNFTFGNDIYFSCNIGYDLTGVETLQCQEDGNWNTETPYCTVVTCTDVSAPTFGNVNSTKGDYGLAVEYRCNPGYDLVGKAVRVCLPFGEWATSAPYCQIKTCRAPYLNIANGRALSKLSNYTFSSTIEFECNQGYEMVGNSVLTCSKSAMWDNGIPFCIKINCPKPGGLEHGRVGGSEDVLQYTCNDGYQLVGSAQRRCLFTGQWDVTPSHCLAVVCPTPSPVSNGVIVGATYTFGYQISYMCDVGYTVKGYTERNCLATGQWDVEEPQCDLISCGPPPVMQNGKIIGDNFTYGKQVLYICDEGYYLDGVGSRECMADGSWNLRQPRCQRVTCKVHNIDNGAIQHLPSAFYAGTTVTYVCNPGFRLQGSRTMECGNDGLNVPADPPTCERLLCPKPNDLLNGHIVGLNPTARYSIGSTIQFICNPTYKLEGLDHLKCLDDGTWSSDFPICRVNICPEPLNIANGYYRPTTAKGEYHVNDNAVYTCDVGFEIVGQSQLICRQDASWSSPAPSCSPVDCGAPQKVPNAVSLGDNYAYSATVTYQCLTGYQLRGSPTLECDDDGDWVGNYPTCIALCENPPFVPHATFHVFSGPPSTEAIYSCEYGYELRGNANTKCDDSGNWDVDRLLSCEPIYCESPADLMHGQFVMNDRRVDSDTTFSCNTGYGLLGPSKLICKETGLWDGDIPRCQPIDCGLPPNTTHFVGDDFTFGREVKYECPPGTSMLGDPMLICQANGEWSGNGPSCNPNSCGILSIPANGRVVNGDAQRNIFYGDTIVYDCNNGYRLLGEPVLTCLVTARWSASVPVCQSLTEIVHYCDARTKVANSKAFNRPYTIGETATIGCEDGYYPHGTMDTMCLADKSWHRPAGKCRRVYCGRPRVTDMMNVVVMGYSYYYQDTVRYMCRPGLHPAKFPPILTCQQNGRWDAQAVCTAECKLPCLNGGMCIGLNQCKCRPGYGGLQCEIPICILPCLNGGVCVAPYRCGCPKGYGGSRCNRALCDPQCENGGRCTRPGTCQCYNGFIKPYCKTKVINRYRRRR